MNPLGRAMALASLCCVASACVTAGVLDREGIAPEAATGFRSLSSVESQRTMVASANPHASHAGQAMLRAGGSATDAVIAMSLVLTLVEPQSSGIGGGAFLLRFDAATGSVLAYDGRETAPGSASPTQFLDGDTGAPLAFLDAAIGGTSVGVPGLLRMLEMAHAAHGHLPWARLFAPAIALAEDGFLISPRLHALVAGDQALAGSPSVRSTFYDADGVPRAVGDRLTSPALAEVLRAVATGGADAFYSGPLAQDIVDGVNGAWRRPGSMTLADLAGYRAVVRDPVCAPYRAWRVCGMGPPTSGGITVLQILGILSHFDVAKLGVGAPEAVHLFAEASRLAYADRAVYIADPDHIDVPTAALLAPDYLARRAALITPGRALGTADPGQLDREAGAPDISPELPSTSHMVAVDAQGNAVTMTASIEHAFGSRIMVRGFLLNNELTDFAFQPEVDGRPVANRLAPGKRPRSSMAPTLVLDGAGEKLVMALGSPGGSRIIDYVARTLVWTLDFGLDVQTAIAAPNVVNRNGKTEIEGMPGHETWTTRTRAALTALGHDVVVRDLNSGLQAIQVTPTGYRGGADPRREGLVLGD